MEIILQEYRPEDMDQVLSIWNEVIEEGGSIPYETPFTTSSLQKLIDRSTCAVTAVENERVEGMYVMGPNLLA